MADRHIPLKAKLLVGIAVSTFVAGAVFLLFMLLGNEILDRTVYGLKFMDSMGDKYFNDLQAFVQDEDVSVSNLRPLDIWCSRGDRVYLSVYLGDEIVYESVLKSRIKLNPAVYDPALEDEGNRHELVLCDGTVLSAFLYYYSGDAYYYWTIVVSGFFSFISFYACFIFFVHRKLKYIERLKTEIDILAGGNLDYQICVKGSDELGELANGIEQLRKAVVSHQIAEDRIRAENTELVTALSHDLRTPLTSLLVYLELLDGGKYDSEEQMKHFIRRSLEKTGLIKSMADKLFEYLLAYSSGWDLPELEKVDADPLFSRYWMDVVFSLESKGFMTESSFSPLSCSVLADVSLLARAFDNISSNVEKYSDPSVPVVFACFREDDMVCIRISNGILPQPLKKDSSGIGLRTCRRIAGYHNGSFSSRAEGGVFVEEIRLPVFKSDSTE